MKCPSCSNELFVDHVSPMPDGGTKYFYACINPQCSNYRKTFSPSGDEAETQIKQRKDNTL